MIDTTTEPTTLVMRHTFNAPQARVFEAWSSPEILSEFIAPREFHARVEADVRTGGNYRIAMIAPDGGEMYVRGTYRDVTPPSRIVCTWAWEEENPKDEQQTLLTLEFNAIDATKTELVLTHVNFRDAAQRDRHQHGWAGVFEKLERALG